MTTCVGLRYGLPGGFSWNTYRQLSAPPQLRSTVARRLQRTFPSVRMPSRIRRHTPRQVREYSPDSHRLPLSGSPQAPTDPEPISVVQETLVYRCAGFPPALSLLMPTFAFPCSPHPLEGMLLRPWNALLPPLLAHGFGSILDARLLSMPCHSTSELLRTL